MKYLSEKRRRWFILRAANEYRRKTRRTREGSARTVEPSQLERGVSKFPKPDPAVPPPQGAIRRGSRRRLYYFLKPPATFSLRHNYIGVASFFQHLRHEIYRERSSGELPIGIEFEALRVVSPAAALLLAAELSRWQGFVGARLNAVRQDRWFPEARAILTKMGLFDFLETPNINRSVEEISPQVEVMKYRSDTEVSGAKCDDLLSHLAEISGPIDAENFIYDGLIEALKNSKQHAYSDKDEWFGVPPGTWFMSGSFDRGNKSLTAAVYDLGVGIPKTLPRSTFWEHIRPLLRGADDGQMISAAMAYGRTRTGRPERGNGLPTMMRILDFHRGYLRIVSGTGEATYDSVSRSITSRNNGLAIGGTLIEWSISK